MLAAMASCGDEDDTAPPAADDDHAADDDSADDDSADDPLGQTFDFCPTRIDVFGYSNVEFTGCGGSTFPDYVDEPIPAYDLVEGAFEPGSDRYDATLAGMLQTRLLGDPELVEVFGAAWGVRSCATGGGHMNALVGAQPGEPASCDPLIPTSGLYAALCTDSPAPVMLYAANNVNDLCHGGESEDDPQADDEAAFQHHVVERLRAFVDERRPGLLLVSPMHEWHPNPRAEDEDPLAGCSWQLPQWNRLAVESWPGMGPGASAEPLFVGDLQDEFRSHHPCCEVFDDVTCGQDWFADENPGSAGGGDGWVHFDCTAAEALADLWFAALRDVLLTNEFSCGSRLTAR